MSNSVEVLSDIVEVLGVETGDRDTTIHCHVDVVVFTECVYLILVKTSVGKHANLAGDVAPVVLVAQILQLLDKTFAHVVHTA